MASRIAPAPGSAKPISPRSCISHSSAFSLLSLPSHDAEALRLLLTGVGREDLFEMLALPGVFLVWAYALAGDAMGDQRRLYLLVGNDHVIPGLQAFQGCFLFLAEDEF